MSIHRKRCLIVRAYSQAECLIVRVYSQEKVDLLGYEAGRSQGERRAGEFASEKTKRLGKGKSLKTMVSKIQLHLKPTYFFGIFFMVLKQTTLNQVTDVF